MKKIALIISLIISTSTYSQINSGDMLMFDTTILSNYRIDCSWQDIVLSIYNDTIYCIDNKQKTTNSVKIIGFSTINNSIFEVPAYFNDGDEYLKNLSFTPIKDFWIKDGILCMLSFKRIYKFKMDNNTFRYLTKIELDFKPDNAMLLSNGNILFYEKGKISDNKMYSYNLEKEEIICEKKLVTPIPVLSIFDPRDIIGADNQYIFYSPANEYIIRIYDYNFKLIDSIVYKKENWKSLPIEKVEKVLKKTTQQVNIIHELSDDIRDKYSSITRIFIMNDKLVVMYFMADKGKHFYLYDIWQKDQGKWNLIKEGVDDYAKGNFKNKNRFIPFSKFIFYNNYIFRFSALTPIIRENYKTEKEFIKAYEDYQIENDCLLGVEKLKMQ